MPRFRAVYSVKFGSIWRQFAFALTIAVSRIFFHRLCVLFE